MKLKPQTAKLPKGVHQTFIDEIASLGTPALAARVVDLQVANQENEAFKESEKFLSAQAEFDQAKERYQLVAGPIKDVTVAIKNKTKLLVDRLKEKGQA